MSKLVKQMEIDALAKTFNGVRDMVLLTADKVDSQLDFTTRKTLRDKKVRLLMVKNALARKVFENQGVKVDANHWSGPTLVAWGSDSIKELSKTVDGLIKEIVKKDPKAADKYKIKTAIADGLQVSIEVAKTMPTRLEAIADLLGAILGPASELAACIVGPGAQVASQIASIAEKKEG